MTHAGPGDRSPLCRWLILAGTAAAAVALSAAIGILPTSRLAGRAGLTGLAAAGAVVWVGCAVGALPAAVARQTDPRRALVILQTGMALRLALTLALALAVALGTAVPRTPLLLWIGIHYMVGLAATIGMEIRLLSRKREGASA